MHKSTEDFDIICSVGGFCVIFREVYVFLFLPDAEKWKTWYLKAFLAGNEMKEMVVPAFYTVLYSPAFTLESRPVELFITYNWYDCEVNF